jgi:hypothetical protein
LGGLVRTGGRKKLRTKAYLRIANEDWRDKYDSIRGFIDQQVNEYWDMTEDQAREQMKNR